MEERTEQLGPVVNEILASMAGFNLYDVKLGPLMVMSFPLRANVMLVPAIKSLTVVPLINLILVVSFPLTVKVFCFAFKVVARSVPFNVTAGVVNPVTAVMTRVLGFMVKQGPDQAVPMPKTLSPTELQLWPMLQRSPP